MPGLEPTLRPLTAAQLGVWYATRIDPANPSHNTGDHVEIRGRLDVDRFRSALRIVAAETEALLTRFVDGPAQLVLAEPDWELTVVHTDPYQWMRADLATPVDLTTGSLVAQALFPIAEDQFLWYQRVHHILLDGTGSGLVMRRVAEVYTALVAGTDIPAATFGDIRALAEDEAAYRETAAFERDRAYWGSARPEPVTLAGRGAPVSNTFHRSAHTVSKSSVDSLAGLPGGWPTAVIAATALYLSRMTGTAEVVLGFPAAARVSRASRTIPGMVANVLPLAVGVTPATTVGELLEHAADQTSKALRHQRYRFEDLRRDAKRAGVAVDRGQQQLQRLGAPFPGAKFEHAFLSKISTRSHRRHQRALGAKRRQPGDVVAGRQHAHVGGIFVLHHLADADRDVETGGAGVVGGHRHRWRQLDVVGECRAESHERNACQRRGREVDQSTDHVSPLLFRLAKLISAGIISSRERDDNVRIVSKPHCRRCTTGQIVARRKVVV